MLDLEKLKQAVLTFMQAKNDDEEAFTCYLATLNVHVILKLIEQNKALEADLETERLRLAACGVAALGYFDGCKDEYRSASLEDTLRLYESNKELVKQLAEHKADAERYRNIKPIIDDFPEINPSNYDHDDAYGLNAWGVELVLADEAMKGATE